MSRFLSVRGTTLPGLKRHSATLGRRLKKFRLAWGLTQQQLAKKTGVQQDIISRLELGQGDTGSRRVRALAVALGVSTDYLLGLTSDPTPKT